LAQYDSTLFYLTERLYEKTIKIAPPINPVNGNLFMVSKMILAVKTAINSTQDRPDRFYKPAKSNVSIFVLIKVDKRNLHLKRSVSTASYRQLKILSDFSQTVITLS
jgi:hypothetical protein